MLNRFNQFAKRFALKVPVIIQAPMAGGITTPQLVAAVSNSNGLGSFAAGYLKTEQVEAGIREIKKMTTLPFSVNVFIPNKAIAEPKQVLDYQHALNRYRRELGMAEENDTSPTLLPEDNLLDIIDVLISEDVPIISFTFGNLPRDTIKTLKKKGVYLIGTATSLEEAKILAACDIDAVIAQGYEAGGHRGGFFTSFNRSSIGTMALVPRIVQGIDRPVIAAGGIMDGGGIVAAMALGASAVQLGTAFLTTKESGADPSYKAALSKTRDIDFDTTTLTKAYSGKYARGILTEFIEHIEANVTTIPPYPIPNTLSSPVRKEAAKKKSTHIMSMWGGQGVSMITEDLTAYELMEQLRTEACKSSRDLAERLP